MDHDNELQKDCNTCKCLTCQNGMIFSGACPKGNNCDICKKSSDLPNYKDECHSYTSGY